MSPRSSGAWLGELMCQGLGVWVGRLCIKDQLGLDLDFLLFLTSQGGHGGGWREGGGGTFPCSPQSSWTLQLTNVTSPCFLLNNSVSKPHPLHLGGEALTI